MNRECYIKRVHDIICNGGSDIKNSLRTLVLLIPLFLIVDGVTFLDSGSNPYSFSKNTLADESGPTISNYYLDPDDSSTHSSNYLGKIWVDVVDSDGVDSVWMQYHWEGMASWVNKIMENHSPSNNDTYSGSISGTLEPGYNHFFVKFFANDSLGNLAESEIYNDTVYYNAPDLPSSPWIYLIPIIVYSSVVIIALVAIGWWYKKRR